MATFIPDKAASVIGNVKDAVALGTGLAGKANTIANAIGGVKSSSHIRDLFTNGFLSRNSVFKPKIFPRAFDEPTYLTFKIVFDFDDEEGVNKVPTMCGLAVSGFDFNAMPQPLLMFDDRVKCCNTTSSQIDEQTRYSTMSYLYDNLGEYQRYNLLGSFISRLKEIQNVYPYYFKSISGLETLTSVTPEEGIRVKDGKIEIECEEGVDLKITQLMQTYRKIVWDDVYQRWIVPDMMRYFRMKIYISEIRLFHEMRSLYKNKKFIPDINGKFMNMTYMSDKTMDIINGVQNAIDTAAAVSTNFLGTQSTVTKAINTIDYVGETLGDMSGGVNTTFTTLCDSVLNMIMPTICIDCQMCEFDISNTFEKLSSFNSFNGNEPVSQKLKINVGKVYEYQTYPLTSIMDIGYGGLSALYIDEKKGYTDENQISHVLSDKTMNMIDRNRIAPENTCQDDIDERINSFIDTTKPSLVMKDPYYDNKTNLYNEKVDDTLTYYPFQENPGEVGTITGITAMAASITTTLGNYASNWVSATVRRDSDMNPILRPNYDSSYVPANTTINPYTDVYQVQYLHTDGAINPYDDEKPYTPTDDAINPYDDEEAYTPTDDSINPYDDEEPYTPTDDAINPYLDEPDYIPNDDAINPYDDEGHYIPTDDVINPYDDEPDYIPTDDSINPYMDEPDYIPTDDAINPYLDDPDHIPTDGTINPYLDEPDYIPTDDAINPYNDDEYNPEFSGANPYLDEGNYIPTDNAINPYNDDEYNPEFSGVNPYNDDPYYSPVGDAKNPYMDYEYEHAPISEKIEYEDYEKPEFGGTNPYGEYEHEPEFSGVNPYGDDDHKPEADAVNPYDDESYEHSDGNPVNPYNNDDYKPIADAVNPYDDESYEHSDGNPVNPYNNDDYKPEVDAINPYDDDEYKPEANAVNPYDDDEYKPESDAVNPYDDNEYKPEANAVNPYDDDDYKPEADAVNPYDNDKYTPEPTAVNPYDDDEYKPVADAVNPYDDDEYEPEATATNPYNDDEYKPESTAENPYDNDEYKPEGSAVNPYNDDEYKPEATAVNPYSVNEYKPEGTAVNPYNDDEYKPFSDAANPYSDDEYEPEATATNPYDDDYEFAANPYGLKDLDKKHDIMPNIYDGKEDPPSANPENPYTDDYDRLEKSGMKNPDMQKLYESVSEKSNELTQLWVNIYNNPMVNGMTVDKETKERVSAECFYNVVKTLNENGEIGDPVMVELLKNTKNQLDKYFVNGERKEENNAFTKLNGK